MAESASDSAYPVGGLEQQPSPRYPLPTERTLILAVLFALAAIAWGLLIWHRVAMGDEMPMGLTMGMSPALYIALWAAMMVAIMFPTAAPMIVAFARVQAGRQEQRRAFVPTWLFVSTYITLWSATGVVAYAVAVGGDALAGRSLWLMEHGGRLGGGLILFAGIYQLTPLKQLCLSKCRSPVSFILGSWRDGRVGAVRMGIEHGIYCLGCCWLLFAILLPIGMMNVAAMAVITLLIFAEKSLAIGPRIAQAAAVVLIAYGVVVIAVPKALMTG